MESVAQKWENPELEITGYVPGRYVFGSYANVGLQLWLHGADENDARALRELTHARVSNYPEGISTIHWLRRQAGLPTPEARAIFSELMAEYGHWFGESVVVLDGDGFWAGAVRSMLTGLRMAAGNRVGYRVTSSLEEAMDWLPDLHRERTGVSLTGTELLAVCQQLASHAQE